MPNEGQAFIKGGIGCFIVFIACAFIAVLFGGSAHLDFFGAILLLLIGGIIGLIVNWIYQKGKKDGKG